MNIKQKVSIITPSYNDAKYLGKCVQCIKFQGVSELEWIIIDDESTDDTPKVVKNIIMANPDIKIIYKRIPNSGACVARNIGYQLSSGIYIKFLDADDLLENNHILVLLEKILANNLDIVVGSNIQRYIYKEKYTDLLLDRYLDKFYVCDSDEPIVAKFLRKPLFHHSSLLIHRQIIDNIKGWDETLLADQDGNFLFRLFMNSSRVDFVRSPSFIYQINFSASDRITNDTKEKVRSRYLSVEKMRFTLNTSFYHFQKEIKYSLSKKYLAVAKRASIIDKSLFTKTIYKKNILESYETKSNRFIFKLKTLFESSYLNYIIIYLYKKLRIEKVKVTILMFGKSIKNENNIL